MVGIVCKESKEEMKIIHAHWEYRNLGVKTAELVFEKGERWADLQNEKLRDFEYLVAKVPVEEIKLLHELENDGFRYLETLFSLKKRINVLPLLPSSLEKTLHSLDYHEVTDEKEFQSILTPVEEGLFETDRYALDPLWGSAVSSKRYANWLRDLFLSDEDSIFLLEEKGVNIGFFTLKERETNAFQCLLHAIFKSHQGLGLSHSIILFPLLEAKKREGTSYSTTISGNNIAVQNLYSAAFSFKITQGYAVLRKMIR